MLLLTSSKIIRFCQRELFFYRPQLTIIILLIHMYAITSNNGIPEFAPINPSGIFASERIENKRYFLCYMWWYSTTSCHREKFITMSSNTKQIAKQIIITFS